MSYAAMRRFAAALPWADLPILTRALPAAGSLVMLLPAGVALLSPRGLGFAALLLWAQALLLACAATRLAAAAHERLLPWERRGAPGAARERVRAWLLRRLAQLGGIGMAGPLVLAAVLDAQAGTLRVLPGVVALLSASLGAGLVLGLSWRGRAPRPLALAAASLLALLLRPGGIEAVVQGAPLASLLVVAGAGLLWCSLLPAGALAVVAPPWPRLRPPAWLRRAWLSSWHYVPLRNSWGEHLGSGAAAAAVAVVLQFQAMFVAHRMGWLAWGQPYGDAGTWGGYGLALLVLFAAVTLHLIAPPLHWRHRLAPRGLTARRWARRLVWGSVLTNSFSVILMLGIWLRRDPAVEPGIWASALGDLLLASSFAAWLRGRSRSAWDGLPLLLGAALAAVLVLAGLNWLGATPQRGWVWLLVQAALALVAAGLAIRAWAQSHVNAPAHGE